MPVEPAMVPPPGAFSREVAARTDSRERAPHQRRLSVGGAEDNSREFGGSGKATMGETKYDRGNISALKVKAMAIRLRHKTLAKLQQVEKMASTYSTLTQSNTSSKFQKNMQGLKDILYHPFSALLLAFPLLLLSYSMNWGALLTFWLSILAMIPLAKILGDGTEELAGAIHNDTISGLLNATLGNAVEMILSVQTLRKGLLDVVKATLLGSILSNILLVLGTSFLLGGLVGSSEPIGKHHIIHAENLEDYEPSRCTMEKEQVFSSKGALVNMAMQLLACMTCALPTVFATDGRHSEEEHKKVVEVSRIGALIIMFSYVAYILFQLVTHKRMLALDEGNDSEDEDEGGDEEGGLDASWALGLMAVATLFIAMASEIMVQSIEMVVAHCGIPARFIGIILLPFAGNACEHSSAIRFAMQDRPGLSLGIAVGSSTQIALFVVPFTVVMGWILDQPMDLVFGSMNTAVMILSNLVVLTLVIDGRSNWLKGFMLCTAYLFCAVLYWYMPPPLE